MLAPEKQLEILRRGAVEIISEDELLEKIRKGKPLVVKLGIDATAPQLHLGHTVVLQKMRQFQDLGHQVVLLIGDYTAMIGDPTGRSSVRQQLTLEEVKQNAATYFEQACKILDPDKTTIRFNSEWLSKLTFEDVIHLTSQYTVARMLEREDFAKRYAENKPISIHEFLYPLMQGYDSVALQCDVELGATEQKFNILMGRTLQKNAGQAPQSVILMPILVGTDGTEKMSKSKGNYIAINEEPHEMYGKVMSIPDDVMLDYYRYVTQHISQAELAQIESDLKTGALHPRDAKMRLAREIVAMFHGKKAAQEAENHFKQVFQRGQLPDEMPEIEISQEDLNDGKLWVVKLVSATGLVSSNSEARRLIRQGAVKVDNRKVGSIDEDITVKSGLVVQIGKRRFARIKLV